MFFLSGKTYYQALWTAPQGNAYWILAHAYIAAQLNKLNGASVPASVQTALDQATALFNTQDAGAGRRPEGGPAAAVDHARRDPRRLQQRPDRARPLQ